MRPNYESARIIAFLLVGYGCVVTIDFAVSPTRDTFLTALAYSPAKMPSSWYWAMGTLLYSLQGIVAVLIGIWTIRHPSRLRTSIVIMTGLSFLSGSLLAIATSYYRYWTSNPFEFSYIRRMIMHFAMFGACILVILARRGSKSVGPACRQCGYLLIGLSGPRCPECGRVDTLDEFYQL